VFDLIVTIFCALTLLVLAFAGCGATSKEEEMLDTLLLIARNVLQFGRLASVMRQSGQSIFTRPRPIDLSAARRAGYSSLDLDLEAEDEDEDEDPEFSRPHRHPVLFNARDPPQRPPVEDLLFSDMPRVAQPVRSGH